MKNIFTGPWLHWLIVIVLVAAGWIAGTQRLHVSEFNPFLVILIVVTVAVIVLVLKTSGPDQRVTRDPVVDQTDEDG